MTSRRAAPRRLASTPKSHRRTVPCAANPPIPTDDAADRVQDLSRGAALAVYRIAQEAMGNAVRHGAARGRSPGALERLVALTVTDDGKGFDPNQIGGVRGLGLINMRERARQLNGTFELNSEPGRGTTVRVTIPFRRAV